MTMEELSNHELLILHRNAVIEWCNEPTVENFVYMEEVSEEIEGRMCI